MNDCTYTYYIELRLDGLVIYNNIINYNADAIRYTSK